MSKIIIQSDHLTESEYLKIRVILTKVALRSMQIRDTWTFFKRYFPDDNTDEIKKDFRLCLQTQSANEEITEKLEQMVDLLKSEKELILKK